MAFNPFNAFRKHKKKAFAILTIVCMFVFILSSGLGGKSDLLNLSFFGGGRDGRSAEVARIDGKKIDVAELQTIQRNRRIANLFMTELVLSAEQQLSASVTENRLKDMDILTRQEVGQLLGFRQQIFMTEIRDRRVREYIVGQLQQGIEKLDDAIKRLEIGSTKKSDDADILRRVRSMLVNDSMMMRGYGFFRGGFNTGEEVVDFMLWKWVADQRGVDLTNDTVFELIHQDTYGVAIDEKREQLALATIKKWNITSAQFQEILREEYRVRIAQNAVLGASPSLTEASPTYVTPHEFYKYYKDNRTTVRASLLEIDAESFLDKVTDKPTEAELKDLFAKHQKEEPRPFVEAPGFKEPKKLKVEWLSVKADNPAIKKLALEQAQKDQDRADALKKALASPPAMDIAGVWGRIGAIWTLEDQNLMEKRMDKAYEEFVRKSRMDEGGFEGVSWTHSALALFGVHTRSKMTPEAVAVGVADMLGAGALGKPALAFSAGWSSRAVMEEIKERVRVGMAPFGLAGPAQRVVVATDAQLPLPASRKAMTPVLKEQIGDAIVRDFIGTEVKKVQDELTKKVKDAKDLKKPETRKEAETIINDFVKKYSFTRGASTAFHDQFSMINDTGLKPLREAYLKDELNTKRDPKGAFFGFSLVQELPFQPSWFQGKDASRAPVEGFKKDEESYLVWKTDEEAPKVRKFEEARADVERAWRLAKARDLAKKAAEEMQKEVRDKGVSTKAKLEDYALQHKAKLIELDPMSKLTEQMPQQIRQGFHYTPPSVPGEKVNYATNDFADKIVDLRDKPIGEATVLHDLPKNLWYVAVLTDRTEPSEFAFWSSYQRANGDGYSGGGGDPMLKMFANRQRAKFEQAVLDQLKADAKLKVVPEELKRLNSKESGGGSEMPDDAGF